MTNVASDSPVGAAARPSADERREILASGLAAPSAENRHELRFRITPAGSVELVATGLAGWSEQPHRKLLAQISFGAVVENMALHAGAIGLSQTTHWLPQPDRPELVARMAWHPSAQPGDPLAAAIPARHTNRRFYRRGALGEPVLARLAHAAAAVPGAQLRWLDPPALRRVALQAIRLAETERFRRRELHAELFGAVRFELGWRASAPHGLPPGALEVEPPMRPFFAALRHWPLMRAASRIGAHHLLGLRAGDLPCRLAPHLGLLVAADADEDIAALHAGRALQRVWLAAAAEGLAFQPMAASTALAAQRPGSGWVEPAVQARLRALLDTMKGDARACPLMLFRIGRAAAPNVVTERLPVDSFLDPENAR